MFVCFRTFECIRVFCEFICRSNAFTDAEKALALQFRSAYVEFAASGRIANWAAWDGQEQKYTFLATNGSSSTNIDIATVRHASTLR
jgi:hypothetical protein